MQLTCSFLVGFSGDLNAFIHRPFVRLGMANASIEPTERTIRNADVRVVHMTVYIEVCQITIDPLAHLISKRSHRKQIVTLEQRQAVFERESFPALDLFAYFHQCRRQRTCAHECLHQWSNHLRQWDYTKNPGRHQIELTVSKKNAPE